MNADAPQTPAEKEKARAAVRREVRALVRTYRRGLWVGFTLMIVGRFLGFVLPTSTKILIDEVLGKSRWELLTPLALAVGVAALLQAVTTFAVAQVVSIAAQEAIMEMRKRVQEKITRLPIGFFDDTQSGVLISRIMTDAEGIRNLIGTGIIQLVGGALTALLALGVLFYLNWQMTIAILVFLIAFGAATAFAFRTLRPIFRERGRINAEVTGRLAETLGGIRVVKAYRMEEREQRAFAAGALRLFQNVKRSITGTSAVTAFATVIVGAIGVLVMIFGGGAIRAGAMSLGDLVMYVAFIGVLVQPIVQMSSIGTQISEAFAGLDRIREVMGIDEEDAHDAALAPLPKV